MTMVESPLPDVANERLREAYRFEEVHVERVLSGGMFARPVLLRTDRGWFVCRVHAFRNTEHAFRFQAETIEAASIHGVPCSRVEPTCDGRWCIPLAREDGVLALHRFVEGNCDDWLAWHRRKQSGFLHSLGRQIAELHNALEVAEPSGERGLNVSLPPIQLCFLEGVYAAWRQAMQDLRRTKDVDCGKSRDQLLSLDGRITAHWERLMAFCAENGIGSLSRQIVHGDISPVNIVFDSAARMRFIDWDCVHIGHRLYDALGDVLNRPPDDRPDLNQYSQENVDEYLDGYASSARRPFSDLERRLVPPFCLARQLEDLRQRLYTLANLGSSRDELYARLIGMRVDMMDQIGTN